MSPFQGEGRRFEPGPPLQAPVAQWIEQFPSKEKVAGSTPAGCAKCRTSPSGGIGIRATLKMSSRLAGCGFESHLGHQSAKLIHVKSAITIFLVAAIFSLVGIIVASNYAQQKSVDRSKLPEKVEMNKSFQKWITNLKNKGFVIEADEFRLLEEVEVYNTKWITVSSIDNQDVKLQFDETLKAAEDVKGIVFSPNDREFIDYRYTDRGEYLAHEARFYGLREDKVIDARILDCSVRANCYFDRAYFIDNDVFAISEISRNLDEDDVEVPGCDTGGVCTYTFKIHVIDLINNKRLIYESKPFDVVLDEAIENL